MISQYLYIFFTRIWVFVFIFNLLACSSTQQKDSLATSEARQSATPKADPQRTITNFTRALQCMDDMFVRYNVSDLVIGAQPIIDDSTAEIKSAVKDMLITALSIMSRRSNAVRFVVLGSASEDLTTYHNLHQQKDFRSPDFFIRLSAPQIDKGTILERYGVGLRVEGAVSTEFNKDRLVSIISLDMNMGLVKNLQTIPGLSSNNSIAVVRKGMAFDVAGSIRKLGALFEVNFDNAEGLNHSIRTLIDLGAIELMGLLTQVPYWECLDIETTAPQIQSQIRSWYMALTQDELRAFVQSKLEALNYYHGKVDGNNSLALRLAVATYKKKLGLIANGKIDVDLYYNLISDQTPIKTTYLPLLTRRVLFGSSNNDLIDDEEDEDNVPEEKTVPQHVGLKKNSIDPLSLIIMTERGSTPVYRAGEQLSFEIRTSNTAYIYCYYQVADGKVYKLFPNRFVPSAKIPANTNFAIPGKNPYKLKLDKRNSTETVMCMASYFDIDADLPAELGARNFQEIPVSSLEEIYEYYKSGSESVPLKKTLTVNVY